MARPDNNLPKRKRELLQWLADSDTVDIYAATLNVQAQVNESQTRSVLGRLDAWRSAKSVLDAGCGPGIFRGRFEDLLKGKRYVGIDKERDFIFRARRAGAVRENIRFIHSDFFDYRGRFDVVYLWAVLQHLPSVGDALRHARSLLNPRGAVILLDSSGDEEMKLAPAIPSVSRMYARLQRVSRSRGRHDDCIEEVKRHAGGNGFKIAFEEPVRFQITSMQAKRNYSLYVVLVSELIQRFYSIRTDREKLLTKLSAWEASRDSRVTVGGGRWLMLTPK